MGGVGGTHERTETHGQVPEIEAFVTKDNKAAGSVPIVLTGTKHDLWDSESVRTVLEFNVVCHTYAPAAQF